MEALAAGWQRLRESLDVALLGSLTLWALLYALVLLVALFWIAARLERWIGTRLLARSSLDAGARAAAGAVARYALLGIGLLVIVQTAGIDLTPLNVLAGAIGIGIGIGLQNVVSNFFAGLVILFERPIKLGDRIEVDGVEGDVVKVGARSTTVLTNDNIAIIVPNSKFITENVVNWKWNDDRVRFRIPVSVAYGSDAARVEALLLEVAAEAGDILKDPAPAARFLGFGENGLEFELRAWSSSLVHRRGKLVSTLNHLIYRRFTEEGIEFPYPSRDLRVRGGTLQIRQVP